MIFGTIIGHQEVAIQTYNKSTNHSIHFGLDGVVLLLRSLTMKKMMLAPKLEMFSMNELKEPT